MLLTSGERVWGGMEGQGVLWRPGRVASPLLWPGAGGHQWARLAELGSLPVSLQLVAVTKRRALWSGRGNALGVVEMPWVRENGGSGRFRAAKFVGVHFAVGRDERQKGVGSKEARDMGMRVCSCLMSETLATMRRVWQGFSLELAVSAENSDGGSRAWAGKGASSAQSRSDVLRRRAEWLAWEQREGPRQVVCWTEDGIPQPKVQKGARRSEEHMRTEEAPSPASPWEVTAELNSDFLHFFRVSTTKFPNNVELNFTFSFTFFFLEVLGSKPRALYFKFQLQH